MTVQWLVLGIIAAFIAFSYMRHYGFKTRVVSIVVLLIMSLFFVLPIFPFSILKLLGLFLFERLWILLALILFIESVTKKNNRTLLIIIAVISIVVYFYLRTMI
ncbi:hypothetical protein [Desnuesiella massiliensis]|uniref:hypothetical protein n=1 Tax=Desnuesiella massiliensis TaxID=1650662 RepID=UPI0006E27D76|nr:hypothetical protein [Desnuesiella massiliensis]